MACILACLLPGNNDLSKFIVTAQEAGNLLVYLLVLAALVLQIYGSLPICFS